MKRLGCGGLGGGKNDDGDGCDGGVMFVVWR